MLLKFNEHSNISQLDEYFSLIRRDCKPFLELLRKNKDIKGFMRKHNPIFFRGMHSEENFLDKKVRKDRKQKDSHVFVDQKVVDDIFFDIWGIRPRSQGLFCSCSIMEALRYGKGNVYAIFPKGNFDYLYCEASDYNDIWLNYIEEEGLTEKDDIPLDYVEYAVEFLHHCNNGIEEAIKYNYETIFLCDSYYAIRLSSSQYTINDLIEIIEQKIYQ